MAVPNHVLHALLGSYLSHTWHGRLHRYVVDDELVKVVRLPASSSSATSPAPLSATEQFSQQVLSGVRFAPLIHRPLLKTVIPSRVWSPAVHQYYPDSFRKSCKELLLCSHASYDQPFMPQPSKAVNLASMLPTGVWMEIMSYTHRNCKFWLLVFLCF
jgi:hypothetical protein